MRDVFLALGMWVCGLLMGWGLHNNSLCHDVDAKYQKLIQSEGPDSIPVVPKGDE